MELPSLYSNNNYQRIENSNSNSSSDNHNDNNADSYSNSLLYLFYKKRFFYIVTGVLTITIIVLLLFTSSYSGSLSNEESIFPVKGSNSFPFKTTGHPDPPTSYWGRVTKPYPTGAFWTNLVVKNGDGAVGVYPYGVKTVDSGIQVSYGATRRIVKQYSIADIFDIDLEISSTEQYVSRGVEKYDSVSVTMSYKTNNNGKYETYLVKSSPFVTVYYENTTPVVRSDNMRIINVEARVEKDSTGMQYIVTLGNFQRWLVYSSEPVALTWEGNMLKSPLQWKKGIIRVAILPVQSFEQGYKALAPYVSTYPTGGEVSVSYPDLVLGGIFGGTPQAAQVKIKYHHNTINKNSKDNHKDGLIMLALPHHISILNADIKNSTIAQEAQYYYNPIYCIKGKMTAVVGDTWLLKYELPTNLGFTYNLKEALPTARMEEIAHSLLSEVTKLLPSAEDPYSFGKEIARMSMLALIADYFGIAEVRSAAISEVKIGLIPWLEGVNADPLMYDTSYGGIVSSKGLADFMADFGQGWYNDHHFHYGYFLFAAAAINKIDISTSTDAKEQFFANNDRKEAITAILNDICNIDSSSKDFPLTRHKDYYDGHSWASGLFSQANGKNQESSGEAVNAYYGAYLYALITNDKNLQWYSLTLLAMEVHSTQHYWQMSDKHGNYDAIFASNKMVGNIGSLDVTASTWFGNQPEYVHGIQLLPITPVTELLFKRGYVESEYPVLEGRIVSSEGSEKSNKKITNQLCSDNNECSELGLEGNCCPNDDGAMLSCCSNLADTNDKKLIPDEWKSLMYIDLAVVDRETAWGKLMPMKNFGNGNSRSNALFWTASRPPPLADFNNSKTAVLPGKVKAECSANSACDAQGMLGDCCPSKTDDGEVALLCCPN